MKVTVSISTPGKIFQGWIPQAIKQVNAVMIFHLRYKRNSKPWWNYIMPRLTCTTSKIKQGIHQGLEQVGNKVLYPKYQQDSTLFGKLKSVQMLKTAGLSHVDSQSLCMVPGPKQNPQVLTESFGAGLSSLSSSSSSSSVSTCFKNANENLNFL